MCGRSADSVLWSQENEGSGASLHETAAVIRWCEKIREERDRGRGYGDRINYY
jgi:hypothetical protein